MRRWLLRRLGALDWLDEITEQVRRADKAEHARQKMFARARTAEVERDAALTLIAGQDDVIRLLVEPDFGEVCRKVRCYSRDIAERFARTIEHGRRMPPGTLTTYTCPRCPLQPVTGERWHHVCHAEGQYERRREHKEAVRRARPGPDVAPILDASKAAELHARLFRTTEREGLSANELPHE